MGPSKASICFAVQERRVEVAQKCKKWNNNNKKNGLNKNLTRSEGKGAPEEKAKECCLKEKDQERCEQNFPFETIKPKGQMVPGTCYEQKNKAHSLSSIKDYVGGIYLLQLDLLGLCWSDCIHNISIMLLLKGIFSYAF